MMIERIGLSFIDYKPISETDKQLHEKMMSAKVFRMHKKVVDSAFKDRPYIPSKTFAPWILSCSRVLSSIF